jgi:uncharacterized membrane protein YfcA
MEILVLYLLAGCAAGFFAGLLGIGGGIILVPVLVMLFTAQGIPEALGMPLALGTSLASILFTSLSSVRSHHARGAVDWSIVRRMTPGLVAGALLGAAASVHVPPAVLKLAFLAFTGLAATQLLVGCETRAARSLPRYPGLVAVATAIGAIAGTLGVAGASISVPFMTWCSVALHRAIGTAAALAFPMALFGAIGYVACGRDVAHLPQLSFGFVHLPALVPVALGSIVAAPLGVALAHRLPVTALKRLFAAVMYAVAARMLAAGV